MSSRRLLVTAERVWDGLAARPVEHGFVLVEDGAVAAVGRQGDLGVLQHCERVDLPGATVLPGLVNGHVHMTFSASLSPVADYLREAAEGVGTLMLRAVANLEAAARVGVTTVRDLGTVNQVAFPVRDAAADGRLVLPRVVASGMPVTVTGGHCHWFSHACDSAQEVRVAVRRQVAEGADVIKIFAGGGNLTPRTNPFAPQYETEELAACVAEARRLEVSVASHAHAPEAIRRSVAAGVDTVEHCSFETRDGVAYDPAVGEAMAAGGIAFCPTLGESFRRAEHDPALLANPVARRFIARLPAMRAAMRRMVEAGVPVLAGSDAGVTRRPFDDYAADVACLVGNDGIGLTPRQALVSATSGAAEILGLSDTGVLAPGRRADLLAVSGDPLRDAADLVRTRYVLIGGQPVALLGAGVQAPLPVPA